MKFVAEIVLKIVAFLVVWIIATALVGVGIVALVGGFVAGTEFLALRLPDLSDYLPLATLSAVLGLGLAINAVGGDDPGRR